MLFFYTNTKEKFPTVSCKHLYTFLVDSPSFVSPFIPIHKMYFFLKHKNKRTCIRRYASHQFHNWPISDLLELVDILRTAFYKTFKLSIDTKQGYFLWLWTGEKRIIVLFCDMAQHHVLPTNHLQEMIQIMDFSHSAILETD